MPDIKEDDVRAKAYELWEASGRKHGDHDTHWHEAVKQLTTVKKVPAAKAPKAPKAAKATKAAPVKAAAATVAKDTKTAPVARKRTKPV